MKNILDELTGYRVKVEHEGKEIVNVPGLLCLPGLLVAPKLSIAGIFAAPLLKYNIHLENAAGKTVDVGKKAQEAAEAVIDTAKKSARTVKEEIDKAWETVSADDPEECPAGEENENGQENEIPVIAVNPDEQEKSE